MNAYLPALLDQAHTIIDTTVQDLKPLDAEALNWKPWPEAWSAAQCLEHLMITNDAYGAIFDAVAEGTHRPTLFERLPLLPRLFGPLVLWAVSPDTSATSKTPSSFEPTASTLSGDIVDAFADNARTLVAKIESTRHVDHRATIVASPFARVVTYDLETAAKASVTHLERHRRQAVRTADLATRMSDPEA